jgi:hypothetical protein
MKKIFINSILYTKDGRRIGNAIVTNIEPQIINVFDDKEEFYTIYTLKTDYGNIVKLIDKEIKRCFRIGKISDQDHKNFIEEKTPLKLRRNKK